MVEGGDGECREARAPGAGSSVRCPTDGGVRDRPFRAKIEEAPISTNRVRRQIGMKAPMPA